MPHEDQWHKWCEETFSNCFPHCIIPGCVAIWFNLLFFSFWYATEMAELEQHPLFDEKVKLSCLKSTDKQESNANQTASRNSKEEVEDDDEEAGVFTMFDSMEAEASKAESEAKDSK